MTSKCPSVLHVNSNRDSIRFSMEQHLIAHGTSSYTFHNTGEQRKILQNLSCSSNNLVYLINCKCCIKKDPTLPCQYIGQTCRTLRERFGEHRRGIENNIDESVPIHFNQPEHTLNDVQVSYMSTVTEIAFVFPWNNISFTKLELCKTASIELVTTKHSYLDHVISLLYIHITNI